MPKSKRKKEIVLFALDVIFFVAALVPTMPVAIRWILWFTCWTMTAILVQIHFEAPKEIKQRVAIVAASALLFVVCFQSLARSQWREEKASALSGDIEPMDDGRDHSTEPIRIEIGTGLTFLAYPSTGARSSVEYPQYKDKFNLERRDNRIYLTMQVRDRNGNLIVEITDNHWTISKPNCWDKNYDSDTLEVKDATNRVVLHARILPTVVQLEVEWSEKDGPSGGITESGYDPKTGIRPWFKYPSEKYWGDRVDN